MAVPREGVLNLAVVAGHIISFSGRGPLGDLRFVLTVSIYLLPDSCSNRTFA